MAADNNAITRRVYLSPKCALKTRKGRHAAFATEGIEIGELIAIDHVFATGGENAVGRMKMALVFQPELFDQCFPRTSKWRPGWIKNGVISKAADTLAGMKLRSNCIRSNQSILLGSTLSRFHRTSSANAHTVLTIIATEDLIPIDCRLVRVVATRAIAAGEEICLRLTDVLADEIQHRFTYQLVIPESMLIPGVQPPGWDGLIQSGTFPGAEFDASEREGLELIGTYLSTREFVFTMMNQVCIAVGFYRIQDTPHPTKEFLTYLGYSGPLNDRFFELLKAWTANMFESIFTFSIGTWKSMDALTRV